jgi:hypothetical protein
MQKVKLLTYADHNYYNVQVALEKKAKESGVFDEVISKTKLQLLQTNFYKAFKHILDQPRGAGYWLWKAYYIYLTLGQCQKDDILVYMDCGDSLEETDTMRDFLINRMKDTDILLTDGAYPNKDWTKRDCFVLTECDEEKYWNGLQVEAGIIVVKNTWPTQQFLLQWLDKCQDERILTDMENTQGKENFETFKDHRHDQSVLSLFKIKYGISSSNEMRKYVHCNKFIADAKY